ncbi:MAG TPA: DUF998 domain-containing protein [Jiangellaceae bacterium]
MTTNTTPTDVRAESSVAAGAAKRTRLLLTGGAAASPIFIAVALIQAVTRTGFDPVEHPLSLLSVGDLGWIQIANFVITGLLFVAAAVGLRRVLSPGPASVWGPRLIGAFGAALIVGGVFVTDPGLGFPPGTPEGIPDEMSWHAIVHAGAPVIGFLALSVACFVFARRSLRIGERGWAGWSIVTGISIQVLGMMSNVSLNFIPLWIAMVLGFGWASAQVARLMSRA